MAFNFPSKQTGSSALNQGFPFKSQSNGGWGAPRDAGVGALSVPSAVEEGPAQVEVEEAVSPAQSVVHSESACSDSGSDEVEDEVEPVRVEENSMALAREEPVDPPSLPVRPRGEGHALTAGGLQQMLLRLMPTFLSSLEASMLSLDKRLENRLQTLEQRLVALERQGAHVGEQVGGLPGRVRTNVKQDVDAIRAEMKCIGDSVSMLSKQQEGLATQVAGLSVKEVAREQQPVRRPREEREKESDGHDRVRRDESEDEAARRRRKARRAAEKAEMADGKSGERRAGETRTRDGSRKTDSKEKDKHGDRHKRSRSSTRFLGW
ncbi:hypothetical protein PWT90_11208 [Aphanocladium album]|nr:hypothetical protein PWT90_11208 [Aphanocladium album]